jgi:hypothetical protein
VQPPMALTVIEDRSPVIPMGKGGVKLVAQNEINRILGEEPLSILLASRSIASRIHHLGNPLRSQPLHAQFTDETQPWEGGRVIKFMRGGDPSHSWDWEEPRPPFDCRFGLLEKEERGMKHKRAYLYRCYPTREQVQHLARTFGCARFVYNWALRLRTDAYKQRGEHVFYSDTSAALTTLKQQEATCLSE